MIKYRLKPLADFLTVTGKVKQLYGCSFADSEEFFERIESIRVALQHASPDDTFDLLISTDQMLREDCRRCLELNGLSFADVSLRHLQDLLLYELQGEDLQPGLLVRINMPRKPAEVRQSLSSDPETAYARALAVLATHTQSLEEAIRLTHMLSAQQLDDLLTAKSQLGKPRQVDTATLDKFIDLDVEGLQPVEL